MTLGVLLGVLLGQGFTAERVRKPAAFWRGWAPAAPRGLVFALLLGAAVCAGLLLPPVAARAADGGEKNTRMLALVNAARAESGLASLAAEPRLAAAACRHAQDLGRGGPLTHRGSDGSQLSDRVTQSGYEFALAAENLAAGVATPDETVWLWLGSPGHRRNILTPDFRQAGIARVTGAGGEIWVLVLAAPRAVTTEGILSPAGNRRPHADLKDDNRLTCY